MTKFSATARSSHGFGSNRRSEKLHRKEILRIYFPKNNQRTTGALFVSSALDAISGGFHAKAGLVPRANLVMATGSGIITKAGAPAQAVTPCPVRPVPVTVSSPVAVATMGTVPMYCIR